jgi:hypothetical protein
MFTARFVTLALQMLLMAFKAQQKPAMERLEMSLTLFALLLLLLALGPKGQVRVQEAAGRDVVWLLRAGQPEGQ